MLLKPEHYTDILQPGSKKTMLVITESLPFIIEHLKLETQPKLLKKTFFTVLFGYRIQRNHYLGQQLNKKNVQAFESGLLNYWLSKHAVKPSLPDPSEPKVLTMVDLEIGFKIWMLFSLVSLIVFIFECLRFSVFSRSSIN